MGFEALLINHLVRRSFTQGSVVLSKRDETQPSESFGAGPILMFLTSIVLLAVFILIQYTLRSVVATLAMIEHPSASIVVTPVPLEDTETDEPLKQHQTPLLETGTSSITVAHAKPITSKIRTTLKHLKAINGYRTFWRGFRSSVLYTFGFNIIYSTVRAVVPGERFLLNDIVAAIVASALTAPLHLAWTHTVISMPSAKSPFARISIVNWKEIAVPATVCASVPSLLVLVSMVVFYAMDLNKPVGNGSAILRVGLYIAYISLNLFLFLFVSLPAIITYIRIEASLLPDEDETIVPFDRTFDNKVVPRIIGGTGAIGFLDAWRTVNNEARRRIFMLFVKFAAIIFAYLFSGMLLLVLEMVIFHGANARTVADGWQRKIHGSQ